VSSVKIHKVSFEEPRDEIIIRKAQQRCKEEKKKSKNSLCPPYANSIYFALSNPTLYSLPLTFFFSPLFATASHRLRMCSLGTRSSLAPLNINIGVVAGIKGIFDAESHFWWQRKENGPSAGRACGTREGNDVNVFSRTRASSYEGGSDMSVIGDEAKRTLSGLRLARSIATAPPMDWPYRILKVERMNKDG
jgi:hypothetical protein